MGKKYYCDYCDKTMIATPSIIKTHINGVVHQKLVKEHYHQYKDPETILREESVKNPCSRFLSGECKFGFLCRYSHYTQRQLEELKKYIAFKNTQVYNQPSFEDLFQKLQDDKNSKSSVDENNTMIIDSNGFTHVMPWRYHDSLEIYGDNLPPSIRKLRENDFKNIFITYWG